MERYIESFNLSTIPEEKVETVIIGSGVAGLSTALQLSNLGIKPLIISEGSIGRSNSFLAQGGIAAAIGRDDDPEYHYLDTIKAGKGLCIERNVRALVEEGVERVVDLIVYGVNFDRENGRIKLTREGAHSKNRVLHVKDRTGSEIGKTLWSVLSSKNVSIETGYSLREIITDEKKVTGVVVSDKSGRKKFINTKSVVIATGGFSALFHRNTSQYKISGETLSIAYRAGCTLMDLEFVQFHPTALDLEGYPAFLISEAVRGEGAILVNQNGERFIDELKPRDEVARAIFEQIKMGNKVFLDISPLKDRGVEFEERFPSIANMLEYVGLKGEEKIPVSPAAHYTIGGIRADANGKTSVNGIFAVGEVSCTGVHGANRLASNSLLECIVFGFKTAYSVFVYNMNNGFLDTPKLNVKSKYSFDKHSYSMIEDIKKVMWEKVGLVRDSYNLQEAIRDFEGKYTKTKDTRVKNLSLLALATAQSALYREESRGVHYRKDFPYERKEFKKHTIINKNLKIKLEVS